MLVFMRFDSRKLDIGSGILFNGRGMPSGSEDPNIQGTPVARFFMLL